MRNNGGVGSDTKAYSDTFLDAALSLFNQSLVGASVVLYDANDIPVACSTIDSDHVESLVAPIYLKDTRIGSLEVSQVLGDDGYAVSAIGRAHLDKGLDPLDGTKEFTPVPLQWWFPPTSSQASNCGTRSNGFDLTALSGPLSQGPTSTVVAFRFESDFLPSFTSLRVAAQPTTGQPPGLSPPRCDTITRAKTATAKINMKGVLGTVTFRQESAKAPVHVLVYAKAYTKGATLANAVLAIHTLPAPRPEFVGAKVADVCTEAYTGAVFSKPLCSATPCGDPAALSNGPEDTGGVSCCQIKDSGKGEFASARFRTQTGPDAITLFGPRSIVGRAIVLKPATANGAANSTASPTAWACANIVDEVKMKIASVTFSPPQVDGVVAQHSIIGSITFKQELGEPAAATTVAIDLNHVDSANPVTTGHEYSIESLPSPYTCNDAAAVVFNPTLEKGTKASDPHLDLRHAPYVLYGVKYIDLVSLMTHQGRRRPVRAAPAAGHPHAAVFQGRP